MLKCGRLSCHVVLKKKWHNVYHTCLWNGRTNRSLYTNTALFGRFRLSCRSRSVRFQRSNKTCENPCGKLKWKKISSWYDSHRKCWEYEGRIRCIKIYWLGRARKRAQNWRMMLELENKDSKDVSHKLIKTKQVQWKARKNQFPCLVKMSVNTYSGFIHSCATD